MNLDVFNWFGHIGDFNSYEAFSIDYDTFLKAFEKKKRQDKKLILKEKVWIFEDFKTGEYFSRTLQRLQSKVKKGVKKM